MKRAIENIGMFGVIIGIGGMAGAIELGQSVARPLLLIIVGALMLGSTTIWEVVKHEIKTRNNNLPSYHNASRPYYLR